MFQRISVEYNDNIGSYKTQANCLLLADGWLTAVLAGGVWWHRVLRCQLHAPAIPATRSSRAAPWTVKGTGRLRWTTEIVLSHHNTTCHSIGSSTVQGGAGKWNIHHVPKKGDTKILLIINRLSNFFHCQILQHICSTVFIKDSTAPHKRRYTTWWDVNVKMTVAN